MKLNNPIHVILLLPLIALACEPAEAQREVSPPPVEVEPEPVAPSSDGGEVDASLDQQRDEAQDLIRQMERSGERSPLEDAAPAATRPDTGK